MSHNYIVTAQKPTAVTACITGQQSMHFVLYGGRQSLSKINGYICR